MSTPDFIGDSLAASTGTIVLGAPGGLGSSGLAYVFAATPHGWRQTAELGQPGTAAGDRFGAGVATMAGGTTVVANERSLFRLAACIRLPRACASGLNSKLSRA